MTDDAGVLHRYKLYTDLKTNSHANASCASRGQHFVTISNKREFDFVVNYLRERKCVLSFSVLSQKNIGVRRILSRRGRFFLKILRLI